MGDWLLRCAARYVPVLAVGYVCASAVGPRPRDLPFWESLGTQLGRGFSLALGLGAASLFLLLLLGLCKRYGSTGGFRTWAAVLLLIPLVPLWLGGLGGFIAVLMLAHLAFAIWIMPKPQLLAP